MDEAADQIPVWVNLLLKHYGLVIKLSRSVLFFCYKFRVFVSDSNLNYLISTGSSDADPWNRIRILKVPSGFVWRYTGTHPYGEIIIQDIYMVNVQKHAMAKNLILKFEPSFNIYNFFSFLY